MTRILAAFLIVVASFCTSCATGTSRPYSVLNQTWIESSLPGGGPDTRWGRYRWAAASDTFAEAARRWEAVLADHGECEDGLDFNMWLLARQELMRAYYATGRTAEADAILKELRKHWQ